MGTGSDDNKNEGILKLAERVLKKPFTTALWVFATDNTLDVKRVKNNENQAILKSRGQKFVLQMSITQRRISRKKKSFYFHCTTVLW